MKPLDMRTFAAEDGNGAAPPSAPAIDTKVSGETSVPGDSSEGAAFDGLGDFQEFEAIEIPAEAASPPPSKEEPKAPVPAAPPAAPAAAAPAPAPAPAAPPASPPPQAEAPQAPQSTSMPTDVGSLIQQLEANASGVIDTLAADPRFGLNADEVTMIETNPAGAVPRLLARTYYQAVNATLTHINNLVPNMIERHLKGVELQQKYEKQFYGQFPALKPETHGSDVYQFARLFKQQNPQVAQKDFFAMVGAAVMAKHGLMGGAPSAAAQGAALPQPATPPPFAPAAPGASVRTVPVEEHPFAGLGQEWPE